MKTLLLAAAALVGIPSAASATVVNPGQTAAVQILNDSSPGFGAQQGSSITLGGSVVFGNTWANLFDGKTTLFFQVNTALPGTLGSPTSLSLVGFDNYQTNVYLRANDVGSVSGGTVTRSANGSVITVSPAITDPARLQILGIEIRTNATSFTATSGGSTLAFGDALVDFPTFAPAGPAIPEPATLGLTTLGLAALAFRFRRRIAR